MILKLELLMGTSDLSGKLQKDVFYWEEGEIKSPVKTNSKHEVLVVSSTSPILFRQLWGDGYSVPVEVCSSTHKQTCLII